MQKLEKSIRKMEAASFQKEAQRELVYTGTEGCELGRVRWIGSTYLPGRAAARAVYTQRWVSKSYAIIYVEQGTARLDGLSRNTVLLKRGDLFFLFPGMLFRYGVQRSEAWHETFAVFNGPVFDVWRETKLLDPERPVWHLEVDGNWGQKIREIAAAPDQTSVEPLRLITRLMSFLTEARLADQSARVVDDEPEWLRNGRMMLEDHLRDSLSLPEIARQIGLTYDAFRKQFLRHTGQTPARYRQSMRIAAARDLLVHTPLSVKEIANSLGFSSAFHFSECFLQATGVRPREFRMRVHLPERLTEE